MNLQPGSFTLVPPLPDLIADSLPWYLRPFGGNIARRVLVAFTRHGLVVVGQQYWDHVKRGAR